MEKPSAKPSLLALRLAPAPAVRGLIGAGGIGVLLLIWWLLTLGAGPEERVISPVILPSPVEVIRSFPSLLNDRALLQSIARMITFLDDHLKK